MLMLMQLLRVQRDRWLMEILATLMSAGQVFESISVDGELIK